MFDNLKSMAGLAGLMKDMPRIKARFEEVKLRLDSRTVEVQTGGGAVRVTANGLLRITAIEIDHAMFTGLVDTSDPEDRVMAQDLISGAVNSALERARQMAEQEFADAASELGIPLPPGGLGGLI
ncbi:MAG: YbaB/EbfC family nucleoid-associated protein [Planctomycetota bacterium]|jgi:DNA-binding protein YbaB